MDLRSDFDFLKSYMNHSIKGLSTRSKPENAAKNVCLKIKTGFLAGTERLVDKPVMRIGSDESNDIILFDEDVEPMHAEITIVRDFFGIKSEIKAVNSTVKTPIYDIIPAGESRTVRGATNLTIGSVILTIEDLKHGTMASKPDSASKNNSETSDHSKAAQTELIPEKHHTQITDYSAEPQSKPLALQRVMKYPQRVFAIAAICFAVISGFLLFGANWLSERTAPTVSKPQTVIAQPLPPQQYISMLQTEISNAGLDNQLTVSLRQEGSLEVKGQTSEQMMTRWREILQWYDQQRGAPALVNLVSLAPANMNLPTLTIVSFAATNPYIVTAQGKRAYIGETINNGWKIKNINDEGVTLSLKDKVVKITFD